MGVGRRAPPRRRPRHARPTPQRLLDEGTRRASSPRARGARGKPYARRYRLERFGRGGFAEIALRTGAPIVPCAVVGSEEVLSAGSARVPGVGARCSGALARSRRRSRCSGRWRPCRCPSRWRIEFGAPVDAGRIGPGGGRPRALVLELTETVRERIQAEGVRQRWSSERERPLMAVRVQVPEEFREVMDRIFAMMGEDPRDGPEAARRRRARSASSSPTSTWW